MMSTQPHQQQQHKDYGTITPSSSSSITNITANTTNRVNIIRNRFFSYCDDDNPGDIESGQLRGPDEEEAVGQYGYENDHSVGCDKRWIRMRSGKGDCCRCSGEGRHLEDNTMDEEEEEEEEVEVDGEEADVDLDGDGVQRPHVKGSQRWRNVKAVMAYYYALRKIKRNVAFVSEAQVQSISGVAFDGVVSLVSTSTGCCRCLSSVSHSLAFVYRAYFCEMCHVQHDNKRNDNILSTHGHSRSIPK